MNDDPRRRDRLELDGAIREALVAWQDTPGEPNYQWRNSALYRLLFKKVSAVLDAPRPSDQQVADRIKTNGGVMRISEYANYGPILIEPEQLARAYALLADDPDATDEQRRHARERADRPRGAW